MDTRELHKVDLNLLISLQVLIEECNVSRAAERLHITQPAMSKTLSRLRLLFDDPLFTRSSRGMQPTPRALEVQDSLADILGDISHLLSGSKFDPATFQGEITIALSEYLGVALLPRLMARLARQSPQLRLRVITRVENQLEELACGNLDFAIHIQQSNYGDDYLVEFLGGSHPILLVREEHPLTRGEVTMERLTNFPVIRLYVSDWEQGELRHNDAATTVFANESVGSLEISHLLSAIEVLRNTDFFMPAPAYVLQTDYASNGMVGLPVPPEASVDINYAMVAHKRTSSSALHNWLWEEILCTIAELRAPLREKIRQRMPAGSEPTTDPA